MKLTLGLVAAFTLLVGCARQPAQSSGVEAEAALQRFHDRFVAVHANRDISAYGQLHTESVVFWWPGEAPTTGRAALESMMRGNWKDRTEIQLTLRVEERTVQGTRAYEFGWYTESWRDPRGNPVVEKGRYVLAYQLGDDHEWRIARFVGFGDAPPPK